MKSGERANNFVGDEETALNSSNIGDEVCFPVPFRAGSRGALRGGGSL